MRLKHLAFAGLALTVGLAFGEPLDTTAYPYCCEITFAGYAGSSALEDFPALVRIPAGSDVYLGSQDGSDLRFADAEGNLVPHEIDSWKFGGESRIWVRVPRLEGQTTKLTMYFGATAATAAMDPGLVWAGAHYQGVWHFEGSNVDSSANHLVCEDKSWPTSQPKPTYTSAGSIGNCMKVSNDGYVHVVTANSPRSAPWSA